MRAMNTPPAYNPAKKSNTGLIIGLILGGIAVCCIGGVALIGFFSLRVFNDTIAPITECMTGYQAVSNSLAKYAKDHDGMLPSAAKWQDELRPYVEKELAEIKKEAGPFKLMDPQGEWGCTTDKRKTGMAFNIELDGKKFEEVKKGDSVVVFEVDTVSRNYSAKFVEQEKSTSPKIMGDHRGWITVRADRGVYMGRNYVGDGFDFKKGDN
jgi:hypothetical protein